MTRPRIGGLLAEALRVARSQPAASFVTLFLAGAVSGVILGTTGQTAQVEEQVLARIDDAGTRSITITDTNGEAFLVPAVVERIGALSGVEWVIGLGWVVDSRNAALGRSGRPVPVRDFYGALPNAIVVDAWNLQPGTALIGVDAQTIVGLQVPAGGVTLADRTQLSVVGGFAAAEPLTFLNSGLLAAPDPNDAESTLRSVHILTRRPDDVVAVADAAVAVLGVREFSSVNVQTSEALAEVRLAVAGELGRYGRQLVTIILAVGLVLVGLNTYGAVTVRRRDFGRRRALGATRPMIVGLVASQTVLLSLAGAILGAAISTALVWSWTSRPPNLRFTIAVVVLTTLAGMAAAIPPAAVAAYRDPLSVLRVP